MNKPPRNTVKIDLVGGLGNQLFGYVASLSYALKFNCILILDKSQIPLGLTNHGSNIESFQLPYVDSIVFTEIGHVRQCLYRISNLLVIKNKLFRLFQRKIFRIYQATSTGYEETFLENKNLKFIKGYFQSYKYFQHVSVSGIELDFELKNASEWYIVNKQKILLDAPVVLHIRLGDYKLKNSPLGLLDLKYYSSAIKIQQERFPQKNFWIFSDDIDEARSILEKLLPESSIFVSPPDNSDAAESLKLMSLGSAHIISNSSFSWWAAMLSSNPENVIAPSPWFRFEKEPLELLNPKWNKLQSTWSDQ